MIFVLAAPAGAVTRPSEQAVRDVVIERPSPTGARIAAAASAQRYPVNDGTDATVAIAVTPTCAAECDAAEPQAIADFVGTLIHDFEIELLTIQLDTPFQLGFDCGFEAEACYYTGQNKMVISGDAWVGIGGATREFVIAHEYGHHVAQHRESPPPFPAPISWGTAGWASEQRVCQGTRREAYFPGDAGSHYFEDPGEAFAESFAHFHFPDSRVRWRWAPSLKPTSASELALREDTLQPWVGRTRFTLEGRFPKRGPARRWLNTPRDGVLSLRPALRRHDYRVVLRNPAGRVLRTSRQGIGPQRQLSYTVCGQSRLGVVIKPSRRSRGTFKLQVQRP